MSQICKWKNFKSECLKIFSINLQFSVRKKKEVRWINLQALRIHLNLEISGHFSHHWSHLQKASIFSRTSQKHLCVNIEGVGAYNYRKKKNLQVWLQRLITKRLWKKKSNPLIYSKTFTLSITQELSGGYFKYTCSDPTFTPTRALSNGPTVGVTYFCHYQPKRFNLRPSIHKEE